MSHLIWTKDNSDEGKGVKTRLLECYKNLYLESDGNLSPRENVNMITKNLIQYARSHSFLRWQIIVS